MRRLIIVTILIAATLLTGCNKQANPAVEKFVFNKAQIASRTTHRYEFYPDGKIKVDNQTIYYSLAGAPFDSVNRQVHHTYSNTGKLLSTFDPTDSTQRLYVYNELDSLVGDFAINQFGDTTFMGIREYKGTKLTRRKTRMLSAAFPKNADDLGNMKQQDLRNYDTLLYISELIYNGDKLEKTISKDKAGNITSEAHEFYANDKRVRTMTYSFLGSTKYVSEITEYTENSAGGSDFLSTGPNGDTTRFMQTLVEDDEKIVINYMAEFRHQSISYYNKKGWLIGSIENDLNSGTRMIYSYTYDENGNEIEEANYSEKKSNER